MEEYFEAAVGEQWSKPIQAKIEYPMDCFKMVRCVHRSTYMSSYEEPSILIRHEGNGEIYISVNPFEHQSTSKSITLPFQEFVEKIGEAFFGPDWKKCI